MASDTVDIAYLDVQVRKDKAFDETLKRIGIDGAKQLKQGQLAAKDLDKAIKELGLQTNITRKQFQSGIITADKFEKEMMQLDRAHKELIATQKLNTTQMNRLTSSARTARASLDTYQGRVSKLGLAHNVMLTRIRSVVPMLGVALPASAGLAAAGLLRAADSAAKCS